MGKARILVTGFHKLSPDFMELEKSILRIDGKRELLSTENGKQSLDSYLLVAFSLALLMHLPYFLPFHLLYKFIR